LVQLLIWAVPVIAAIILHEVMHGWMARLYGDDTAAQAGRLTLNPLRHIDPFGTLILPALLLFLRLPVFGYAKPVPVNFGRLSNRRLGMILVAAAGPCTNLALAIVSAILLRTLVASGGAETAASRVIAFMLVASVQINVVLAVFNLLPLLPLDGGRVLTGLLPPPLARSYAQLERYGFPLLFLLLYMNWLGPIVNPPINAILRALL
jgi:Zn-dependent protease